MLIDQISDEPGHVIGRQPVIQRRGQQQILPRIERPERLIHRTPGLRQIPLRPLPRCHLEQAPVTLIVWHTKFSREAAQFPRTSTGVLLTRAPSLGLS